MTSVLLSHHIPLTFAPQCDARVMVVPLEEIVDQIRGVDFRPEAHCQEERQKLRASDIEDSLARPDVEMLQDVPGLDTADVLDRQDQALESGDRRRGQRASTQRESEHMKIPIRVSAGAPSRVDARSCNRWRQDSVNDSGRTVKAN